MKDKDTHLIWEQYKSPGREGDPRKSIPFPDGRGEMDEDQLDVIIVRGNKYREVDDNKWERLDAPGGPRPVTSDEYFDIMQATRPDDYERHHAQGASMQKALGRENVMYTAAGDDYFSDEDKERLQNRDRSEDREEGEEQEDTHKPSAKERVLAAIAKLGSNYDEFGLGTFEEDKT